MRTGILIFVLTGCGASASRETTVPHNTDLATNTALENGASNSAADESSGGIGLRGAERPVPTVSPDGQIRAGLSRDQIRDTIRTRQSAIRLCYESELQSQPDLAGRATIHFVVASDGSVSSASITGMDHPGLLACLEREVRSFRFPAPEGAARCA